MSLYSGFERLNVGLENGTAVIQLKHPPANTYDKKMVDELHYVFNRILFDPDVKSVVVTGYNEPGAKAKFFCGGAHIDFLDQKRDEPDEKAAFCRYAQDAFNIPGETPKIYFAAINGHAIGGGYELALACDLRYAGKPTEEEKPYLMGLPEVTLGVLPGTGGTQRLPRLLGRVDKAIEMMAGGRRLDPETAYIEGLVTRLYPMDTLLDRTLEVAYQFNRLPQKAVGNIKLAIRRGMEMSLKDGLNEEWRLQNELFVTQDAKEAIAHFAETRKLKYPQVEFEKPSSATGM